MTPFLLLRHPDFPLSLFLVDSDIRVGDRGKHVKEKLNGSYFFPFRSVWCGVIDFISLHIPPFESLLCFGYRLFALRQR